MSKFNKILEPVNIGGVEIKNRIAMAPMGISGLVESDGNLSRRAIDYYVERARGGVGLIITGVFMVENEIDAISGVPLILPASTAPFAELAETVHSLGSKIFVQLTAGFGRVGDPAALRKRPVAPSAMPNYWDPTLTCRQLATEEVEHIVECFGEAAKILRTAGVDGVEIHAVHEGYLLDQFTTTMFNRRGDKYGGDLRGRLTFPLEIVRKIKDKAGKDFPVGLRFSVKHFIKDWGQGALPGEEFDEKGRDLEEGLEAAKILEQNGYDVFNADAGSYEAWYWAHPPTYQKHGCYLSLTEKLKKVIKAPVIVAGRMGIPELVEKVLTEDKADMVAVGRGLLTDPYWVRKTERGEPERIRPCIGCHDGCLQRIFSGKPLSCALNPATGREAIYKMEPATEPRKVMVVGGGVAGLEAARAATLRGHKVSLYEKSDRLGGHLNEASIPSFKEDVGRLLQWYKLEMENLNPDIKLNTRVTPELIEEKKPDALILATGSNPIVPNVPGTDKDSVVVDTELLLGDRGAGEKAVVIGGGVIGCEIALWLAQQGRKVTVVEKLPDPMSAGVPVPHPNKLMLLDLLELSNVEVLTNHCLLQITQGAATFIEKNFQKKSIQADTFVLSVGLAPDKRLYNALVGKIPNLYLVGDAREAANIMNCIWDAYEVARAI